MTNPGTTRSAVLVSTDLMFVSNLEGAAQRTGTSVATVSTIEMLVERLQSHETSLVMLDLTSPGLVPMAWVEHVRRASPITRIIAFGPHVHAAKLAAAVEAGCDEVLSRGQFDARLDDVLSGRAIN